MRKAMIVFGCLPPLLGSVILFSQLSPVAIAAEPEAEHRPGLVPWPQAFSMQEGSLALSKDSRIVAGSGNLMPLAKILSEEILRTTGVPLAAVTGQAKPGDVLLAIDPGLKGEAYSLEVQDRAVVKGGDYPSLASGTVTLLQALGTAGGSLRLPRLTVADQSAHPYRGVLIDLARKYHSPDGIKQVVELCRLYKIRYMHVHLSDDQLFMFPSRRFPQLGRGNWEFARFEPPSKPKIEPYTREELLDLERFSQERGVHLVPEIDMPGHAGRLVSDAPETFGFPGSGSTLNIANPKTLEAVTALWNEVMDVFQFGREGSTDYTSLQATEKLSGTQLCSWENSESIEIQSLRERLALVGERSWNPRAGGDFAEFKARLAHTDAILEKLVHPITVRVQGQLRDEDIFEEPISITLASMRPGLSIRYTLDNSLPNKDWKVYTGPIHLEQTAHLRAGLFDAKDVQQGYLVGSWFRGRIPVTPNLATRKPVTVGPAPDRTDGWFARIAVDGASDDVGSHWASAGPAPQWLHIDLEKVYPIGSIKVITYYDGSRYYHLNAEVSVDGKSWKRVLEFQDTIPATAAGYSGTFARTDARYVRINMLKNSANPFVHIVEVIVDPPK